MCGIAGIIGQSDNKASIKNMLEAIKHRGPDASVVFYDADSAVLGHNRLSIIDLSANANQPFIDNTGRYVLVFNGVIYNYIELKRELKKSYEFKTQSDTEVLLAAYIHWGSTCLKHFNGMFAFAIWDVKEKKLFAARDRFGIKPFYYAHENNSFYFASEIKALHQAGIVKIPNEKVWASYFAYGTYGNHDETFWEGISQLAGGHFLEFHANKIKIEKWYYFEIEVAKQAKNLSYNKAKEQYLTLLIDSIKLRFRADVPMGFNISGGLDSSVLLAMVNQQKENKLAPINAYTFYTNNEDYDELPWVETMIKSTQNPLTKVLLKPNEVSSLNNRISFFQDEPFGGLPTLAYSKLFEQAQRDKIKVVLDGQGMDEQWAGYDYYTQNKEATIQGVIKDPFKSKVLSSSFLKIAEKPTYSAPFEDEVLNKQYRDLFYTKIPRALRFNDRISMAFSVELREPFLDHRLVELAFSMPLEFKIKDGVNKKMLRDLASELLPATIAWAPKRPLQTPQREWLGNELKSWVDDTISCVKYSKYAAWFNTKDIEKLWVTYLNGNNQSSVHLWQWISVFSILIKEN